MTSEVDSVEFRKWDVPTSVGRIPHPESPNGQVPEGAQPAPGHVEQTTNYMTRVSQGDRQAFGAFYQHYVFRVASFFRQHYGKEDV